VALWAAENGRLWAQSIDPAIGAMLGAAAELGQLATGTGSLDRQPIAVPLSDGDLALVGLLANGRVTFARGSAAPARRVTPKVVVPATPEDVLGLAAAESRGGTTVVVLRAPADYGSTTRKPPAWMNVELHALGPTGATLQPPLRWKTDSGFRPRVASCGDQRYVVWESANKLVVTSVAADGKRSDQRVLAGRNSFGWPGPIVCQDDAAILVTGWHRGVLSSENLRELSIAQVTPSSAKLQWKTLKVPAPPQDVLVNAGRLAANLKGGQLFVSIAREQYGQFVALDLRTQKLRTLSLLTPAHQTQCIAVADGGRAVCAASEPVAANPPCANSPARVLLSFVGNTVAAAPRAKYEFWTLGAIPDPDVPSQSELTSRRGRLRCGEPGWNEIREALAAWCRSDVTDVHAGAEPAYCSPDASNSLSYQASRCTDVPSTCPVSKYALVPSVDRAAFEKGERIELSYLNCSIFLKRDAGKLKVVDRECTGE